jgi:predicted HTH transcriptional regulator
MADSFESVKRRAAEAASGGAHDRSSALRRLDPRQRKGLVLFKESDFITSNNVAELFSISERAARNLLTAWVANGFVVITAQAKKSRKYELSAAYRAIVDT